VRRGGLLVEVHSQQFNIETVHVDSDAIRADVAVLLAGHRRWSPSSWRSASRWSSARATPGGGLVDRR
jgi:hypothetical protein